MLYDLVIVGNIAFDINQFPGRDHGNDVTVTNVGGAGFYSLLPASLFSKKVGIVARVGNDFPVSKIYELDVDTDGLKIMPGVRTTRFYHTYLSDDGQIRTFKPDVTSETLIRPEDIPHEYFKSRFVHIATNFPKTQISFIETFRQRSSAFISIDTHEAYLADSREDVNWAFGMVDIAFIDCHETALISTSKASVKIIKMGKAGIRYTCGSKNLNFPAKPCDVIDKTGAGDVLAGVFLALRGRGFNVKKSAEKAVEVASASVKDYGIEFLARLFPNCR